jgi:predicted O-methyltransferase YrrM
MHFKSVVNGLSLLLRTNAPLAVYWALAATALRWRSMTMAGDVTNGALATGDWTSRVVPYWLDAFERTGIKPARILEIGAWEGLTSRFLLNTFPQAHMTCVDTWEGGDGVAAGHLIEANFDANMAGYGGRVRKVKARSIDFLSRLDPAECFDLIYVDGSHYADDVLTDSVQGFAHLSPGGLMIFDDYLWSNYAHPQDNPAAAINSFLRLKTSQCRIVSAYYQVIIKKVSPGAIRVLRAS